MSTFVDELVEKLPLGWLAELVSIWLNALWIFRRDFDALEDELAAATWRRFFLTITTTILVGVGLYRLLMGLFTAVQFDQFIGVPFHLANYWVVETAWFSVNAALVDIPFILLVAYLSFYWVSHDKEGKAHWVQEAQMLAITWTVTFVCLEILSALSFIIVTLITRDLRTLALRTSLQRGSVTILNYVFFGLLPIPLVAYRYNLRLHGNKILNGLTGRDRWLLLGFQIVMLEGGTFFVSRLISHLPVIENLYQSLLRQLL